jgi:hypothetical protein
MASATKYDVRGLALDPHSLFPAHRYFIFAKAAVRLDFMQNVTVSPP